MIEFKILQANREAPFKFRGFDDNKPPKGFNLNYYSEVYNGTTDGNGHDVLDKLYGIFNLSPPNDFKGHSLSISDIVILNGEYWFCDSSNWMKIEGVNICTRCNKSYTQQSEIKGYCQECSEEYEAYRLMIDEEDN
ncbi:YodL domain-containing protein [Dehalobacter sp. TeCB1]|uniref:YodL domain-containing protein n=1 Tax=Dehalobacter sp. TeCB1 TaxID=1843715 RepID=UPI00083B1563|nr:YodL domain-containing protein [Dehalobacter sp. TeCB1]OCZ50864.1 hypothetical protein A7D23_14300 [Dehalobacter sp. TeCB1]